MVKILIIGANSQVGYEFSRLIPDAVLAFHSGGLPENLHIDLTNPTKTESAILKVGPDIILNAAAYVEVDKCEENKEYAYKVNSLGVKHIARAASVLGSFLVHISTDYVFSGEEGNYTEDSLPNPVNYYGFTKMIGDAFAMSYDNSLVIRTSGVFGRKKNFPRFAFERLKQGMEVPVINGYYSPISAKMIALGMMQAVNLRLHGTINIAGERTSRLDFAMFIARQFGLDQSLVKEADGNQLNLKARRPFDSSLSIGKARRLLPPEIFSSQDNVKTLGEFNDSPDGSRKGV